jgi:hypothetical protein
VSSWAGDNQACEYQARSRGYSFISFAGNTIMQHLAARPVTGGMGVSPFTPVTLSAMNGRRER